jgi:hypothetical protein
MEKDNRPPNDDRRNASEQEESTRVKNPFDNKQSAEKDVRQLDEELEREQQFKEALTERD